MDTYLRGSEDLIDCGSQQGRDHSTDGQSQPQMAKADKLSLDVAMYSASMLATLGVAISTSVVQGKVSILVVPKSVRSGGSSSRLA